MDFAWTSLDVRAARRHRGEMLDVEEVGGSQMRVALRLPSVDGGHVPRPTGRTNSRERSSS